MFGKKKHLFTFFTFFVVFVILWTAFADNIGASGGDEYVGGTIAAKGPVLDEDGNRIWVEYNEGRFANYIHAPDGSRFDQNSVVMQAGEYRAYVETFLAVQNETGSNIEILARAAYEERQFFNIEGLPVEKPELGESSKFVVVRTIFFDDFLLLESPIDLNNIEQLGDTAKSLLLDENGRVVFESDLQVGFLSAFYSKDPTDISSFCETSMKDYQKGDKLWAPVRGAEITSTNSAQLVSSDEDGDFRISYVIPTCPGTTLPQTNQLLAKLRYCVFDPQRIDYSGVYFLKHKMYDQCSGIGEGHFGFTLNGLLMKQSAESIENSMTENKRAKANIAVDIAILTGRGVLQNEKRPGIWIDTAYPSSGISANQNRRRPMNDGVPIGIPIGDVTTYEYQMPAFARGQPLNPDLDAGGVADIADNPDNQGNVGVWLNVRDGNHDLTRLGDFNPDLLEQGLLQKISRDDLRKTDTYVFRSNGDIIFETQGLHPSEIGEDGTISYSFKIRRPADNVNDPVNRWFNIESADDLTVGETLKVVVVNRETGYMGLATAEFNTQSMVNNVITVPVGNIPMRPPNLCITARRRYVVVKGLTAGDKPEYTIGFEGSGLTSDERIVIETEWTDWDDRQLPEKLKGFTGRLAVVTKKDHLTPHGSNLAQFAIKPGRHTEVIKIPEKHADLHYYIHVSGEPIDGNPNFQNTGPGPALLAHRPKLYVPVRVPIFKEAATAAVKNALFAAVSDARENLERLTCGDAVSPGVLDNAIRTLNEAISDFENKYKPEYKYVYRPEMQFSLYDLDVTQIWRTHAIANAQEIRNILDDDTPIISSSDEIDIRYTLMHNQMDPISVLGPERELVFSTGVEEVRAVINGDGFAQFDELKHLELLEMEDHMAIRLVQNGDDANVLWNYAFLTPLDVRFKIIEEETKMEEVEYENDMIYWTLGGVRLHLVCGLNQTGRIRNYKWSKQTGKFFDCYRSDAQELTDPRRHEGAARYDIYWESDPLINLDETITCEITFENGRIALLEARIRTRAIEFLPQPSRMSGDDVSMLQSVFRLLGISGTASPGYRGSLGIDGEFGPSSKRAAYRFQVRSHLVTGGNAQAQKTIETIKTIPANLVFDNDDLEKLRQHWTDYLNAYEEYDSDVKVDSNHHLFSDWIQNGSNILQNKLTNNIIQAISPLNITREQILEAWVRKEAGIGHWGHNINFKIVLGGWDEFGSIGFSQILNKHKYGSNPRQSLVDLNLYHPNEAIQGFATFSNDDTIPGGGGFTKAFVPDPVIPAYKKNNNPNQLPKIIDCPSVNAGNILISFANVMPGGVYTDDYKDLLSKGLMAYNTGSSRAELSRDVWPEILKNCPPPGSAEYRNFRRKFVSDAASYALKIQNFAGIPLDRYWYWEANVDGLVFQFTYSEEEYLGGTSWKGKMNEVLSQP